MLPSAWEFFLSEMSNLTDLNRGLLIALSGASSGLHSS